jgi:hypothetical protein
MTVIDSSGIYAVPVDLLDFRASTRCPRGPGAGP